MKNHELPRRKSSGEQKPNMSTTAKTIRLIKFGGPWCSHCVAMDKARTLEQFAAVTADIEVLKHDINDPDDEDLVADAYDAQSMPTIIFEEISTGLELARYEGGLPLTKLRELYTECKDIQAGKRKRGRKSQRYEPRAGGYSAAVNKAESAAVEPGKEPEAT